MGLPVFSPTGPGGIAQLLGPTGGFLMAYPFVAGIAGWILETRRKSSFCREDFCPRGHRLFLAEIYLFVGGLSWLAILTHSFAQAIRFGLYWFVFAEVIKIMSACRAGERLARVFRKFNHDFRSPPLPNDSPTPITEGTREITVAHSPDSDDAFMFYGLATNKVRVPGLRFTHTLCDIETLNRKAMEGDGVYDVTAISFHAYPYIQDHYALLPSGGSVGDGYGPMIVAPRAYSLSEIKGKTYRRSRQR